MAETQEYLQNHSLLSISSAFGSPIIIKQHPLFSNLYLLKYKQASGKHFKNKIMRQVRGLIVDKNQNYKPIVYGYDKFFNYHEKFAVKNNEIHWPSVRITEKADGTFMCLYYYNNKWRVSTTGQPDAGESQNNTKSFASMFWRVWKMLNMKYPSKDHEHLCFMFELMTYNNRIIVRLEEAGHGEILWLHGVRDMNTLQELLPYSYGKQYNWSVVKEYTTEECLPKEYHGNWTLSKVIRYVSTLPPTKSEGVVVCDKYFQRLKVKSPSYIALLHLNDKGDNNVNTLKMLQIIKSSEGSEFLSYYPKWENYYYSIDIKFKEFCSKIDKLYDEYINNSDNIKDKCSKNEYEALQAYIKYKGTLYTNSADCFRDPCITIEQLSKWINIKQISLIPNTNSNIISNKVSNSSKQKQKQQKKTIQQPKTINTGFTITQPKLTPKRKEELDNLDNLINSFKESDKKGQIFAVVEKPQKPFKKGRKKKKKSKRR